MQVLINPLYAIASVGFEDNLIDVVVMRMILYKAQEQQELRLQNLESLSHFEDFSDSDVIDDQGQWNDFKNAA